jgi:error-prone DNA polymerase
MFTVELSLVGVAIVSSTRKPIIDSGTRLVVEKAPPLPLVPEREQGLPPSPYVELAVRTAFTGLSIAGAVEGPTVAHAARAWPGASVPEEVADRACLLGYDAFAVADVDTVAGVVRAHSRAKELGLRLIVGTELWLDEGSLLLHAADRDGYTHLCRLLTLAREGLDKGVIDHQLDRVCEHARGLFATLLPPFARDLGPLKDAFGDRLSIGVFRHGLPEDGPRLQWAQDLGRRYGMPLLATGRALLTDRADKRLHDIITCIRQGLTLQEAGQRLMPNAEAVMRTPQGMQALFKDLPEAVARSREIADAATFELGHLKYAFPYSPRGSSQDPPPDGERGLRLGPPPEGEKAQEDETPQQKLERLTIEGATRRYGVEQPEDLPVDVAKQLDHELKLIATLDVAPYFLTVWEIVEIARERGILCQGRGSAANSAVCYCLGITSIDPVRMGLLFERFLSVERGEPPDIDVDFEHERREEVIQAIYQRWGRQHAAMVCNVIAFRGRSAIREVGKVYGLSETVCGKLVGLMWSSSIREVTDARLATMGITSTAHLVERTLHYARRLTGQPRHLGIHVGGFVLTQDPIDTLAPDRAGADGGAHGAALRQRRRRGARAVQDGRARARHAHLHSQGPRPRRATRGATLLPAHAAAGRREGLRRHL